MTLCRDASLCEVELLLQPALKMFGPVEYKTLDATFKQKVRVLNVGPNDETWDEEEEEKKTVTIISGKGVTSRIYSLVWMDVRPKIKSWRE